MHLLPGLCSGWRPVSSKHGQRLPSLLGCGAFPNCAELLGGEQEDGLVLAGAAELPPQLCMVRGGGRGPKKQHPRWGQEPKLGGVCSARAAAQSRATSQGRAPTSSRPPGRSHGELVAVP